MANNDPPPDAYESTAYIAPGVAPGAGSAESRHDDQPTDRVGSASFRSVKSQKRPIGRYQILSRLGAGATAEVFRPPP